MNADEKLRLIAGREAYVLGPGFSATAFIAQVLLEIRETLAAPQPIEGRDLADFTWFGTANATALDNIGKIEVDAIVTGENIDAVPISTGELKRRGVDDELDARAIDVVMRCGWPRQGDPLGIRPCVPVPVETLERMLDTVATISGVSAVARTRLRETISLLLDEQDHINGLYLETADEKALVR